MCRQRSTVPITGQCKTSTVTASSPGLSHCGRFDSTVEAAPVRGRAFHDDDPFADHREPQRHLVDTFAALGRLADHRRHTGVGHVAFDLYCRSANKTLGAISHRDLANRVRAARRRIRRHRPLEGQIGGDVAAVTRRRGARALTTCEAEYATDDDQLKNLRHAPHPYDLFCEELLRESADWPQTAAACDPCHAQVHCCFTACGDEGNMW